MDPVSTAIESALAAGAKSAAGDLAKQAITDGYEQLKGLLKKSSGQTARLPQPSTNWSASPYRPDVSRFWQRSWLHSTPSQMINYCPPRRSSWRSSSASRAPTIMCRWLGVLESHRPAVAARRRSI